MTVDSLVKKAIALTGIRSVRSRYYESAFIYQTRRGVFTHFHEYCYKTLLVGKNIQKSLFST
ncbi:hypothetical protein QUB52_03135 [Microcoleus sp. A6-C6]